MILKIFLLFFLLTNLSFAKKTLSNKKFPQFNCEVGLHDSEKSKFKITFSKKELLGFIEETRKTLKDYTCGICEVGYEKLLVAIPKNWSASFIRVYLTGEPLELKVLLFDANRINVATMRFDALSGWANLDGPSGVEVNCINENARV